MPKPIIVLGATGFVGSAVVHALKVRGCAVSALRAPRLPGMDEEEALLFGSQDTATRRELTHAFLGVRAVVNAAGRPDATSSDDAGLMAANAALPGVVAAAARSAAVPRLVHVSSAAVQGRAPKLDETTTYDAFSAYAKSKVFGEQAVHRYFGNAVIYRPPGVHGAERRVTQLMSRIAASPAGSVAHPPTAPSPQALVPNVGDAIAYLATSDATPPAVVIHPWEGITTGDVMTLLGNRQPLTIPRPLAQAVLSLLAHVARHAPAIAVNVRRLEMLWFGQPQAESWLTRAGWAPSNGRDAWIELGKAARASR